MLLVILAPIIHAKTKSDEFIFYTGDLIFKDCTGQDMIINVNGNVQKHSWPYQRNGFDAFLKEISQFPFKEHKVDNDPYLYEKANEGIGFIICGNNTLDIIDTTWYWNDIEITAPTTIEKTEITQSIHNSTVKGDILQTVNTGNGVNQIGKSDNSVINQSIEHKNWFLNILTDFNLYLGISIPIVFSLIIKWLFKLKIIKKKKR